MKEHIPVMVEEAIEYLNLKPRQKIIDATCGLSGHDKEILKKIGARGKLLAIDQDIESLKQAKKNLHEFENVIYVNDNFKNLKQIAQDNTFNNADGILYDLGVASWHFENSGRGFSFSKDEPLDMRLFQNQNIKIIEQKYVNNLTAYEIINNYSLKDLSFILYKYGDIRKSQMIAQRIIDARKNKKISTTFDLVSALQIKNPKVLAPIFQAFRIKVNDEYNSLEQSLKNALEVLKSSGRIVVISFHSGEDRIVKNFFRNNKNQIKVINKKPILAKQEEVKNNSKSRSAKLRAGEKY